MPRPPVILAIMSLPQRMAAVARPARIRRITMMTVMMILRFLWGLAGFSFIFFLDFLSSLVSIDFSLAFNSPVASSKSKAWTGFRKSSTGSTTLGSFGVGFGAGSGVGLGVGLTAIGFGSFGGFSTGAATEIFLVLDGVVFGFAGDFFCGTSLGATVFLELRELSPSIDLFFSIFYNYSIWRLS